MKHKLLIFFCAIQSMAFSHDYFFAFAELKYDDFSQTFEASISVSAHDLERIFEEKSWSLSELSQLTSESEHFIEISAWILNEFSIESDGSVDFTLIGCETELNGMIHFYLESKPVEIGKKLDITFNFLMSVFPHQQNKLTFYHQEKTITTTFLTTSYTQQIDM